MRAAVVALAFGAIALMPAGGTAARKAASTDWTRTVVQTPEGGFRMGNPKAKVKLVEYGSMTCPHCREFEEAGVKKLIDTYVKPGKVSFEFRNYVRDPFDLAAALVARCGGTKSFFPLTRALFKDQPAWEDKVRAVPSDQIQKVYSAEPSEIAVQAAEFAGFQDLASAHGLAPAKSNQCLGNAGSVKHLVDMAGDATDKFPDFKGVPAFILNGKLLDDTYSWEALEPKLREAVGGKG